MPNWCSNTVVVSGDAADIKLFNEWLGDGKALLNKIKPTPQQLTETVSGFHGDSEKQKELEAQEQANLEKFGAKNWYDWNIANWGTKWDLDVEVDDVSSINEQVIFSFQSAWSPPQIAISDLAKLFKTLNIRHSYIEEGVGFVGYDLYEKGELFDEMYNEDSGSDAWKQLARDEFGWEPWPDDEDELEQIEVTDAVDPVEQAIGNFIKEIKDRVKKSKKTPKKATKKVVKKADKKVKPKAKTKKKAKKK